MARLSVDVPSLVGGVSQQSPQLRLVGQAESQTNFYSSLVDGLQRRHPIDHVGSVEDISDEIARPNRNYHCHVINRSPDEQYMVLLADVSDTSERVQVLQLSDGARIPVFDPDGSTPGTAYLDIDTGTPSTSYKCVTIADYTLVLNRQKVVELSPTLTPTDPSDFEGFLFVRTGNYGVTYRAHLLQGGVDHTVEVTTWDGNALSSGVQEEWELTILTTGGIPADWEVTIFGQTASYTVQLADTPTTVATGLAAAINALNGVSASSAGPTITIVADDAGVHFFPAVNSPTNGTYSLEATVAAKNASTLASVDTSDIAQALLDQILALPGAPFTGERLGAVVHVESDEPIARIRTEEGHDVTDLIAVHRTVESIDILPLVGVHGFTIRVDNNTAGTVDDYYATFQLDELPVQDEWDLTVLEVGSVGKVWRVTILGNEASYTVQLGDEPADVAAGLATAIAALDSVSASAAGAVVTILADDLGYTVRPTVLAPFGGRFDLEQIATAVGTFGAGKWVEGRGHQIPVGFDVTTMPHRLIRRQDDAAGTYTGTPFGKWFEWSPVEWSDRVVGDQDSAPDPSIAGKAVSDMFFYRNRLGFTSGQQVVMSEVNRFFNLYRTTVLSLPDNDPIDISVPSTSVVDIKRATPAERKLLLFTSESTQFVLDGDPLLTPKTVQVADSTRFQSDADVDPIADADGVFFASSRGDFSGVRRMYPAGQVEGQFYSDDTTIAVPQYIPGRILQFACIEPEGLLVVLAEDDRRALYLFKRYRVGDEQVQSSWFRYDLGENAIIQGFGTVGSTLHLVIHRQAASYLERTVIQSDKVDDGADYLTHLDRRVQFDSGTYSIITGRTTWVLPYRRDADETYTMVTRSTTGVDGGDVYPLTVDDVDVETTDVSAQGDHSTTRVWIGQEFESRYVFSKLYLKAQAAAGGQALKVGGRVQVLHGSLVYEKTAALSVEVTPRLRPTRVANSPFSGLTISEALLGSLSLPAGDFRFPVYSEDAVVEVVVTGPLPCALQAAAFECDWNPRMASYRGGA